MKSRTINKRFNLRKLLVSVMLGFSGATYAINTATITSSALSADCMEYRVVGICYWLYCTPWGCKVRTSVKVRHYVPDAVVTSYGATGQSPWTEMASLGSPISGVAESGGNAVTGRKSENNVAAFKNADVIGHPGTLVFNQFASSFGYSCEGAGQAFFPYFLSTLDTVAWRYNLPEMVYPESLVLGMRDIGSTTSANLWGNVYPRGGFTHQTDDYKGAATIAQRAADIVTRKIQPHVYVPMLVDAKDGYWPAGELKENDASTGKWQELTPTESQSCNVFPDSKETRTHADDGAYAWALWRPYSCCERKGQIFLGSIDFQ